MKSVRVVLSLLALLALPVVAASAQGNSTTCSPEQAREVARARAAGRQVPPGLAKKCPPPAPTPPPADEPAPVQEQPPTGNNEARGYVYQDDDGTGSRDMFEMGLAGWTVQLIWNGRTIASATTDADGNFVFTGLGNTTYSLCVVGQSGFTQTEPVSGTGCGGAGYSFPFTSSFPTWFQAGFFGMLPQ